MFSFTTDIIVGFPGEIDEDFKQTCDFIKKIKFTKIHIFPFSPRPNTQAANLKQVHNETVSKRVIELTKLSNQISKKFIEKYINTNLKILFEQKKDGYWHGYTPEYIRIKYKKNSDISNTIIDVTIKKDFLNY